LVLELFCPCESSRQTIRRAQAIQLLSNGKQVWSAARLDDPAHAAYPVTLPMMTAPEYIAALVRSGELKESDLRILTGPHHRPAAKGLGGLSEKNIAFTIYRIGPDDPPKTVFLASKPDVFNNLRVEVHKDGSAQVYKLAQFPTITLPPKATPPTLLP
jgi:hypothetical protein